MNGLLGNIIEMRLIAVHGFIFVALDCREARGANGWIMRMYECLDSYQRFLWFFL